MSPFLLYSSSKSVVIKKPDKAKKTETPTPPFTPNLKLACISITSKTAIALSPSKDAMYLSGLGVLMLFIKFY